MAEKFEFMGQMLLTQTFVLHREFPSLSPSFSSSRQKMPLSGSRHLFFFIGEIIEKIKERAKI
jgi:hypothetical protein